MTRVFPVREKYATKTFTPGVRLKASVAPAAVAEALAAIAADAIAASSSRRAGFF
jgi:hypothetical protein